MTVVFLIMTGNKTAEEYATVITFSLFLYSVILLYTVKFDEIKVNVTEELIFEENFDGETFKSKINKKTLQVNSSSLIYFSGVDLDYTTGAIKIKGNNGST